MIDDIAPHIAQRIRCEREARGWSLSDLAERAGVSKATISKIERGEASPTATVLGRLSGGLGLSLSTLLARAEAGLNQVRRQSEQDVWQDPETGYLRQQVWPADEGPLELVEVTLPAGASVAYPASAYTFSARLIWVLEGRLTFEEGPIAHQLHIGDCLRLGPPSDCCYRNQDDQPCRYVVVLSHNRRG
ncbi:transcriptional regulator with XRE-family HTH domain [Chitinivorax tropicus]|uniref:Transcriptional regulator with XRE-family HTH domain n=1 Tax=Chitinivorax tropicus TaxID=714531 RepID=A0A840MPT6_9PROT|nr:transcriptional regulator with XRE-family HTH domain [Chitinivorax tropicus]